MAKSSAETRIGSVELATAVIAHEAVSCFCGKEQKREPQPKKLVSATGGVFSGKPGETWPTDHSGQPLVPWVQIVCAELDNLHRPFFRRKALCFFIRQDADEAELVSSFDQADFVVREYGPRDNLVPLIRPTVLKGHPFRRVIWEKTHDYPSLSKYHRLFTADVYGQLCKIRDFKYANRSGIKIGGWPTPVQQQQEYPGSCDVQIDMTENFAYGDSGVGYLRRIDAAWHLNFETC